MQTIQEHVDAIVPYSMHVSARYLALTRQKLELTRLPRENEMRGAVEQQWALGTPKSVLEPVLDYWLETYNWRTQESLFNTALPQFRTLIPLAPRPSHSATQSQQPQDRTPIRTHFVHARSPHETAVPLLYIHSWPGSFIEVQRLVDGLLDAGVDHGGAEMDRGAETDGKRGGFHVVCPSIPGFGFSDASEEVGFGVHGAAEVFAGLMARLGYEEYVVCGGGWGFDVARALAVREPEKVLGVFTWNPVFRVPEVRQQPWLWAKWQVARFTRARYSALSFGYVPSEVDESVVQEKEKEISVGRPLGPAMHQLFSLRPQTLAFSLCDSPVGLLAVLLDLIATQGPGATLSARPRSPFLDPGELEMQDREYEAAGHERVRSDDTVKALNAGAGEISPTERRSWTPTDILNWTMMMWLPGAEAGLRWLRRARIETEMTSWNSHCNVPLGISSFRTHAISTPLMWGASSWPIAWVKRHRQAAEMPAWEAPSQLAEDIRECFGRLLDGRLKSSPEMMV